LAESLHFRREGLAGLGKRLELGFGRRQDVATTRLQQAARVLESCSYRNVLARGFAVVRDQAGLALTRATGAVPGQVVEIEFHDACRGAVINDSGRGAVIDEEGLAPKLQKKPLKKPFSQSGDDGQGTLL
jgi:exodeoxyribonuclease VII large subunit